MRNRIRINQQEVVPTLFGAFESFLEDKKAHNLAPASLIDYEESFKYFMDYFEFDEWTPLSYVDNDMFKQWTIDMISAGKKPVTINRYLRDCRVFFNWCIDHALLFINLKIEMVKGQEAAIKSFSDEEIELIITRPLVKDFIEWRTFTIINWVLATGNRARTIVNIQMKDVDFKNYEIFLRETKNKKAQVIPLSKALAAVLKEYIRLWRYDASEEDFLFCNIGNEKLTTGALEQSFAKYCKKRGCNRTSIHGLRHTFALNWVRNGGNEFKLQKMLGHSTLNMTRRYVTLASKDLKEDYECFSALDVITRSNSKKPRKMVNINGSY